MDLSYTLEDAPAPDVSGRGSVGPYEVDVSGPTLRVLGGGTTALPSRIETAKARVELDLLSGRVDGHATEWLSALEAADASSAVVVVRCRQSDIYEDIYRYSPAVLREDPTGDGSVAPRFKWRWWFSRSWHGSPSREILWIALNPSLGDSNGSPRTSLGNAAKWAADWGFGRVSFANVFAWRSTDPETLPAAGPELTGPRNGAELAEAAHRADLTLAAWGKESRWWPSGALVTVRGLDGVKTWRTNADGSPTHPGWRQAPSTAPALATLADWPASVPRPAVCSMCFLALSQAEADSGVHADCA